MSTPTNLLRLGSSAQPTDQALRAVIESWNQTRRELARQWLALPAADLAGALAGRLGQMHRMLRDSGVRDLLPSEADKTLIAELKTGLESTPASENNCGRLLAAMLFLYPHQLPLQYNLAAIPPWLLDEYMRFMMTGPQLFRESGEPEAYLRFTQSWLAYLHESLAANPRSEQWQRIGLFALQSLNVIPLYFNSSNLREVYRQRARFMELVLQILGASLDHTFPSRPPRSKLRLGILAAHFSPQTETFATLPVYRHLDRSRFEVILFALQSTNHPLEQFCSQFADRLVALPAQLPQQVQTLRQFDLDLLFLATNVTAVTNGITLLAMHRLARKQIASVCSCVTTGMRNVDCYISGRLSEPQTGAQDHYTERLFMIDGPAHCYDFGSEQLQQPTERPTRASLGIPADAVVFASGANFYKILPAVDDTWARILAGVPGSRLVLYPFNPNWSNSYATGPFLDRLAAAMSRHGVDVDRVLVFQPAPNRADVLERLKLADVYLDSFPFSGATSLIDPLQLGLPSVVMHGDAFRALVGPALLRDLDLEELIARDADGYVALACRLGTQPETRRRLQEHILRQMTARPRFLDGQRFGMQIGTLLQQIAQI